MDKPITDIYSEIEEMVCDYIERKYQYYKKNDDITADDILEISDVLDVLSKVYRLGGY